jgi:hypothetical protein
MLIGWAYLGETVGKRLSYNYLIDLVNEIEEKFPVAEWRIDSIRVWPIIRVKLYRDLWNLKQSSFASKSPAYKKFNVVSTYIRNITSYFSAYLKDYKHNVKPHPAHAAFLGDQVSRILLNGAWYDRLCEPVIEYLRDCNQNSFHMEPYHQYRIPRNNNSMFIQFHLDKIRVRNRLFPKYEPRQGERMERLDEFVRFLKEKGHDPFWLDIKQLRALIGHFRDVSDFFLRILLCVKPVIAFTVEYYSFTGMAFNLACHRLGIRTIEIPHGMHGDLHIAYSRWNCLPEGGFELLPTIYWCWSDVEAETIRQWSGKVFPVHRPIIGGNPWLSSWMTGTNQYAETYDRAIADIKDAHPDSLHILITYELNMPNLFSLIESAPKSWHWWIRLHPCRLSEKDSIRQILQQKNIVNCEFDKAIDYPLYALLRHVDLHVTEFSSVVIEAEAFGIPSVVTNEYGTEAFSSQISSGVAVTAYRNAEIIEAIKVQAEKKSSFPRHAVQGKISDVIDAVTMNSDK